MSLDKQALKDSFAEMIDKNEATSMIALVRNQNGSVAILRKIPSNESLGEWLAILTCECHSMVEFLSRPPTQESPIATPKPGIVLVKP